jgi:hypothetical protein
MVRGKVVKADGSVIEDTDTCTVTPVCNFMHTLFDSYALTINGHEVGFGPNYPWQAVLETSASRSAGYNGFPRSDLRLDRRQRRKNRSSRHRSGTRRRHEEEKGTHIRQQTV